MEKKGTQVQDVLVGFFIGAFLGFIFTATWFVSYIIPDRIKPLIEAIKELHDERRAWKKEAVRHGAAKWVVDENGAVQWKWADEVEKK